MKKTKPLWIIGVISILLVILVPVVFFWPRFVAAQDDPQAGVPEHPVHTSHKDIVQGPFATPQDVTANCLTCHPDAASQVMNTAHFQWVGKAETIPGHDGLVEAIGKKNLINNFCIGIQGNWNQCNTCHAGYG